MKTGTKMSLRQSVAVLIGCCAYITYWVTEFFGVIGTTRNYYPRPITEEEVWSVMFWIFTLMVAAVLAWDAIKKVNRY